MIQQVIFDCDGVLVDTEIIAAEVMVEFLSDRGIELSLDEYLSNYTGKTFTDIIASLNIDLKDTLQDTAHTLEKIIYDQLRPIEGMPDLLKSLSSPVALVSNSRIWQVEKAMKFLELEEKVGHSYFSAEMVEKPKPSPDVYLHAAKVLGKLPEECLVVEDSFSGAMAAVKAGMKVIGFCGGSHIKPGHESELTEIGVQFLSRNPHELQGIFSQLGLL